MYLIYRKDVFWDLKLCPLQRGLSYCVLIWKSPLSEVHCTMGETFTHHTLRRITTTTFKHRPSKLHSLEGL